MNQLSLAFGIVLLYSATVFGINAPSNLTATVVSSGQINLTWKDNSHYELGFKIESSRDGVTFSLLSTVGLDATSKPLTGLAGGSTYYFRVYSYNSKGQSRYSNIVKATTLSNQVFSGLSAIKIISSSATISWNLSPAETGQVQYGTNAASLDRLSILEPQKLDHHEQILSSLLPNTVYYFKVLIRDAASAIKAESSVGSFKTLPLSDTTAPSVPTGLSGVAISSSQINLSWSASTDNVAVTGYRIIRNGTQIATTASASYSDTGLLAATAYSYAVAAFDAAGNVSAQSSSVNGTTNAASAPTQQQFIIYDATLFQSNNSTGFIPNEGIPNAQSYGILPKYIIYEDELFPSGSDRNTPDEATVRARARAAVARLGKSYSNIIDLDVEHYLVNIQTQVSPAEATSGINKYNQIITWFKSELKIQGAAMKVAYYGMPTLRNYWDAQDYFSTALPIGVKEWMAANDYLKPLVPNVDADLPSIYTFYDDVPGWVTYAKANIAEGRRVMAGKPVCPYIWMSYHDAGPATLADKYIDYNYFMTQLKTVREAGAACVVLWGGWVTSGRQTFDPNQGWFKATVDFLADPNNRYIKP